MRKTVAISLLLLIFINQLGYYFLHSIQQYQARQEIQRSLRANLAESALETIAAPSEQLQWEEDGKEFIYQGQLYDVVSMKVLHGKTYYYCINDTREQKLLDQLVKLVNASREDARGKNIVKFQLTDTELPDTETPLPSLLSTQQQYISFTPRLAFSASEVIPQPPRC